MSHVRWIGGTLALLVFGGMAQAAPLTCTDFRDRLNGAMLASAAKDVQIADYRLAYDNPVRGKRYAWTMAGIEGSLSCGTGDSFEELSMRLAFAKKETFAQTLSQFIALSGASICALASDGATLCADVGRTMLQSGLEQMGGKYNHGNKAPSGLVDRTLMPGVTAELTAAPTAITFLVGPGRGSSIDAERKPLVSPPDNAAAPAASTP